MNLKKRGIRIGDKIFTESGKLTVENKHTLKIRIL